MGREYKVRSIDVWDEESQPILMGVIQKLESILVEDKERATILIDTGEAMIRVWHSAALTEAFDLGAEGDGIKLVFQKVVPLKGGKKFKRISVQVWEGGNLEEIRKEREANQRQPDDK